MEREIKENGGANLKSSLRGVESKGEDEAGSNIGEAIPREPFKLKLQGHRARVTKVIFHPIYTLIATSSEDASIKIWDYETGECE